MEFPEHSHVSKRAAAIGGGMSLATALAIISFKNHVTKQAEDDDLLKDAAILNEPRLPEAVRLRVNRIGAVVLLDSKPNGLLLQKQLGLSRHFVSSGLTYLKGSRLVEAVLPKRKPEVQPGYLAPTEALRAAAAQTARFPFLAQALEELRNAPTENL